MSASVLDVSDQRAAISGKKKKKKTIKNVLGVPANLNDESYCVNSNEEEKLKKFLERLLPLARLPIEQITNGNKQPKEGLDKVQDSAEPRSKRNQLSLGVNDVNRSIKKKLIAAVLLAADIQPKFLNHHLILLCSHHKIPLLHMPGLREITKNSLGFPCIAVGFKTNFSDFLEVIEEIKLISKTKVIVSNNTRKNTPDESSTEESDEVGATNIVHDNSTKTNETPFKYLIRSSIKERIFVPEKHFNDHTKSKTDFIIIENNDDDDDDDDEKFVVDSQQLGISSKLCKKHKKKLKNLDDLEAHDKEENNEDLKVPKKKFKKDWIIDKVETRVNASYCPTNVVRVPSNPYRSKRK